MSVQILTTSVIQILMEATNGLGIILENRYYGDSWPVKDLSTDNLAYLTQEQSKSCPSRLAEATHSNQSFKAIADNAYFAQHATFPGVAGNLTAPGADWILYGGSLAGAETAFTVKTYGDIVFGGIASSGTIYASHAYPQWYVLANIA
jgi:hypothetical protein